MNFYQFLGISGVESQKRFKNKIHDHFKNRSNGRIPNTDLNEISNFITYQLHNNYKDAWAKYPKSRKRYSKFNVEELEQPYWQIEILSLLKSKYPEEYLNYSVILLHKSKDEVIELVNKKKGFEAMF